MTPQKICILIFLMLLLSGIEYPKKLGTLSNIYLPSQIVVIDDQIYISDQKTEKVYLIALNNLKSIKQLSQKGNGPSETPILPLMSIYPDYVFLYSMGKAVYYSRDGKYVKDIRINKTGNFLIPFGKQFVFETGVKRNDSNWKDISLYTYSPETNLKISKTLYLFPIKPQSHFGGKRNLYLLKEFVSYTVYEDKLFIGDPSRGLYIEIFNSDGNSTSKIYLNQFEKQKVTDRYKENYMEMAKRDPYYASAINTYNLIFPEYFPGFYRFTVEKDKLYFLTYNRNGDNREIIVVNWKNGKLIKKTEIPWVENEAYINFSIYNGKFYYIIENEETEEWELHVADIK